MYLQKDMSHYFLPLFLCFLVRISIPIVEVHGSLEGPQGKGYLEQCSEAEPCQAVKWLTCMDGVCVCQTPEEIIFDEDNGQCAALAGKSCLRSAPDTKSEEDSSRYYISCVPHAKCTYPEDECQCEFRYYKADNSSCQRQMGYGASCRADEECDNFKFLSCIGGTCQCDSMHRYDTKNEKCYVQVGNACKVIDFMSISEEHYADDECPEHASCSDGFCNCNPGFKICSDKTCGRDYGDTCSSEEKCSDIQFSCRNQECKCKYPLHQYYEENSNQCISLVTGPCSGSRDSKTGLNVTQICTENAVCHETPAYNYCRCKDGFVENNDGHCVKAYGSSCQLDEECDNLAPLACIENTCNCPDKLQVYDDKLRKCIGLAGARCFKDVNSTMNLCTPHSVCVKTNPQLNYGKCVCIRGSTATAVRTCVKP